MQIMPGIYTRIAIACDAIQFIALNVLRVSIQTKRSLSINTGVITVNIDIKYIR